MASENDPAIWDCVMKTRTGKAMQEHSGDFLDVALIFPQNHGLLGLEIIHSYGLIISREERAGEGKRVC